MKTTNYKIKYISKDMSDGNIEMYNISYKMRNGDARTRYWRLPEDLQKLKPMYLTDGLWYFKEGICYDEEFNILKMFNPDIPTDLVENYS